MDIDKEWLERILKRHLLGKDIKNVEEFNFQPVVATREGYWSELTRFKMRVILVSGEVATKSVILKTELKSNTGYLNQFGMFRKEITIFNEVFPLMVSHLKEVGDESELLWCQCLESRPNDRLVLEDLKEYGYRIADRVENFDLEHASLALRALGKFHALSAVLRERGQLDPASYVETFYTTREESIQVFHDSVFETIAHVIETNWESEYHHFGQKLRDLIGKSVEKAAGLQETGREGFNVLNHGDCWVNNIMFKYLPESQVPSAVRFVDFQMCSFNVPGLDLQQLIGTSVKVEVKVQHMEEMLTTYQESLSGWLEKLGYKDRPLPSLADVKSWMCRMAFFGFLASCIGLVFFNPDGEDELDVDRMVREFEQKKKVAMEPAAFKGEEFTKRMKYILRDYIHQGAL